MGRGTGGSHHPSGKQKCLRNSGGECRNDICVFCHAEFFCMGKAAKPFWGMEEENIRFMLLMAVFLGRKKMNDLFLCRLISGLPGKR